MENAVWAEVYERRPNEFVITLSLERLREYKANIAYIYIIQIKTIFLSKPAQYPL